MHPKRLKLIEHQVPFVSEQSNEIIRSNNNSSNKISSIDIMSNHQLANISSNSSIKDETELDETKQLII